MTITDRYCSHEQGPLKEMDPLYIGVQTMLHLYSLASQTLGKERSGQLTILDLELLTVQL